MITVEHLDRENEKDMVFRAEGNKPFTVSELKTILNHLPEEFKDADVKVHECLSDNKVRTILFQNEKVLPQAGELDFDNRRYSVYLSGNAFYIGGTVTDAYTLES